MGQKPENTIVVLDVGSAGTRVLVGDVHEQVLRYRGHGMVESAGMRKGLIAELAPAAKAVRAASEQAELTARAVEAPWAMTTVPPRPSSAAPP